ncbi:MAG: hypothetical protein WC838_06975, partial [Candidatus Margulisiibacteriota bacterium]
MQAARTGGQVNIEGNKAGAINWQTARIEIVAQRLRTDQQHLTFNLKQVLKQNATDPLRTLQIIKAYTRDGLHSDRAAVKMLAAFAESIRKDPELSALWQKATRANNRSFGPNILRQEAMTEGAGISGDRSRQEGLRETENIAGCYMTDDHLSGGKIELQSGGGSLPLDHMLSWAFYRGQDSGKVYGQLVDLIKQNAQSANLPVIVNDLLRMLHDRYDDRVSDKTAKAQEIAKTKTEVLEKFLQTPAGGATPFASCGSMHGFVMELLHDAGIEAVTISGRGERMGHTALLYKDNGKFYFNNYEQGHQVQANSLAEAIKAIMKNDSGLYVRGVVSVQGIAKGANHKAYALDEETVFGNRIEKNSGANLFAAPATLQEFSLGQQKMALAALREGKDKKEVVASYAWQNSSTMDLIKVLRQRVTPGSVISHQLSLGQKSAVNTSLFDRASDQAFNYRYSKITGRGMLD